MNLSPAIDEELVCISENNACGVDAVQVSSHDFILNRWNYNAMESGSHTAKSLGAPIFLYLIIKKGNIT